ncbi:NAD(P)-binding domain-containing protein [Paenibacillus sp. P96]|uniref:NAD(P)-binding domain-containing protein n=1 Tax=Paenibacillus zeirhizosphaerae TaxID=2987519 RepID=A0ABT9FVZ4_9BACL|nr:NAD(P)-binding domain-containing protein [Paenibacillus sp. P96]MDP4098829.1 NAD(P)-binding domain-containing protein [Paenibacillus sp. P96]
MKHNVGRKNMSQVSVIGLGPMGAALVQALLRNGMQVTVWNRTISKADSLVQQGAVLAPSAAAAINASSISIICVANYKTSASILETEEIVPLLAGRTLVQLSTGTPQEARNSELWVREHGANYLDGAIQAWPSHIGNPETVILYSGLQTVFKANEPILKILAGNSLYLGEAVGSASAQALAVISYLLGTWLGFAHGAHILESENLPIDSFGSMLAAIAPLLGEEAKHQSKVIQSGNFGNPESSLKTSADSVERLIQQAREAGINSDFPGFALPLFVKAAEAGYENEEVSAIIKVLRNGSTSPLLLQHTKTT